MTYELWNTITRTIVGAFATEAEALALAQEAIDAHGADDADTLALIADDGDEASALAVGPELAARARMPLASASLGASPPQPWLMVEGHARDDIARLEPAPDERFQGRNVSRWSPTRDPRILSHANSG